MSLKRRLALTALALIVSIGLGRLARSWLGQELECDFCRVVPGTITFGWYAALAGSALLLILLRRIPVIKRPGLTLIVVMVSCAALILNNYGEILHPRMERWYGAVVASDFLTLIVWSAVVAKLGQWTEGGPSVTKGLVLLVLTVPAFALLREALFMKRPLALSDPAFDFATLVVATVAWILVPTEPADGGLSDVCKPLLIAIVIYWLLTIFLDVVERLFQGSHALGFAIPINAFILALALLIAVVVYRRMPPVRRRHFAAF